MPADNNRAERELRPTVIVRKVSFGSQSDAGAKTREVLMSVVHTLVKRFRDPESHFKWVLDQLAADPNQDAVALRHRLHPPGPDLKPEPKADMGGLQGFIFGEAEASAIVAGQIQAGFQELIAQAQERRAIPSALVGPTLELKLVEPCPLRHLVGYEVSRSSLRGSTCRSTLAMIDARAYPLRIVPVQRSKAPPS